PAAPGLATGFPEIFQPIQGGSPRPAGAATRLFQPRRRGLLHAGVNTPRGQGCRTKRRRAAATRVLRDFWKNYLQNRRLNPYDKARTGIGMSRFFPGGCDCRMCTFALANAGFAVSITRVRGFQPDAAVRTLRSAWLL